MHLRREDFGLDNSTQIMKLHDTDRQFRRMNRVCDHLPSGVMRDCNMTRYDDENQCWDCDDYSLDRTLRGHTDCINTMIQLNDGRIVSGSDDKTLRIWDSTTGNLLQTLQGHNGVIPLLTVIQLNDRRIISGSDYDTLPIWNSTTGNLEQTLRGHDYGGIFTVIQLNDGRIVSGSDDETLRIWDSTTGHLLQTLRGHTDLIFRVIQLNDGRIVSASHDYTLRIWGPNI